MIFDLVLENLKNNKNIILSGDGDAKSWIYSVVVINSKEAIEYISSTPPVLNKYKQILNDYKNFGVLFIYSAIENASIAYNAPEILKRIKDNRKVLFLENISTMKLFDISPSVIRTFAKDIRSDEGYWINGTETIKLKLTID